MAHVIIGATGALGRALALNLAGAGHDLVLVARDQAALADMAGDIARRFPVAAQAVAADAAAGPAYLERVRDALGEGAIDALLLPIGLSLRDDLVTPPDELRRVIDVNLRAPIEAIQGLWDDLRKAPTPVVCGFGSITAVRGRGRNFVYGAAKRALAAYFESLRLAGARDGVAVRFYVVGFLDAGAMKDEATLLPKGDPARLAELVAADLARGSGTRWFPWWWRPLALVIRALPQTLYRRIAG